MSPNLEFYIVSGDCEVEGEVLDRNRLDQIDLAWMLNGQSVRVHASQ